MSDALLEIDNLSVDYETARGDLKALRDITFDINKGEIVGIVLPRFVIGGPRRIEFPRRGEIRQVAGEAIVEIPGHAAALRDTGDPRQHPVAAAKIVHRQAAPISYA